MWLYFQALDPNLGGKLQEILVLFLPRCSSDKGHMLTHDYCPGWGHARQNYKQKSLTSEISGCKWHLFGLWHTLNVLLISLNILWDSSSR